MPVIWSLLWTSMASCQPWARGSELSLLLKQCPQRRGQWFSHPEKCLIISSNVFSTSPSGVAAFFFPSPAHRKNLNSSWYSGPPFSPFPCAGTNGRISHWRRWVRIALTSLLPQVRNARSCSCLEVWPDPGSILPRQHPPHESFDETGKNCF